MWSHPYQLPSSQAFNNLCMHGCLLLRPYLIILSFSDDTNLNIRPLQWIYTLPLLSSVPSPTTSTKLMDFTHKPKCSKAKPRLSIEFSIFVYNPRWREEAIVGSRMLPAHDDIGIQTNLVSFTELISVHFSLCMCLLCFFVTVRFTYKMCNAKGLSIPNSNKIWTFLQIMATNFSFFSIPYNQGFVRRFCKTCITWYWKYIFEDKICRIMVL